MGITARVDATTHIAPEYRGIFLPAPRSCKIELTANCNYKCSFCAKSLRPDNSEIDRKFYSRIIREMRDAGVEELGVFYIGESFTCRWLPDAISEAKAVGFPYVFLTTNGSVATPKRVEDCMKAGLDSLKFSINFSDNVQFEAIAGVKGRFYERALYHLRAARATRDEGGYACGLYASSIAFDGEQGERMRELVERDVKPYVDEFYWLPLYSMNGASEAHGLKPGPGNPGRLGAMVPPLPCFAVTTAHITARGLLSACCFGNGADDALAMADLTGMSFMEGWNSASFQTLRKAHMAQDVHGTPCEECISG